MARFAFAVERSYFARISGSSLEVRKITTCHNLQIEWVPAGRYPNVSVSEVDVEACEQELLAAVTRTPADAQEWELGSPIQMVVFHAGDVNLCNCPSAAGDYREKLVHHR